tara:strand:+ start:3636 stop:5744 length:2109 start_codon:yes stop_codon:yes gene_type:complete
MAEYKDQPTKVPQLPAVPTNVNPNVRQWMSDIKEALEIRLGRRGDQKDRAVTLRELIESGLAKDLTSRPYDPNADSSVDFTAIEFHQGPEDLAVPPTPTSLTASAGLTKIILSWTDGWTQFGNHSYTEVYRHTSNSLGDAIIVGTTQAGMFTDNVDPLLTYYYWVRHVSTTDVRGPFSSSANATAGQVSSTFLADNSVIAAKIADGTIAGTKFASGIKPIEVVGSLPSAGTQGRTVFLTSDNKIYRDTGSAWTAAVAGSDITGGVATSALSGTISTTQIADDAITSAKIAANQVTASEIAANTITASQIASDTITAGQMAAGAIGVDELAANAVTSAKIAANTIVAGDIAAGAVTAESAILADAAVVTAKIADAAITTAKVNDANITTAKINDAAITAAKIATAQINTGHLTNLYAHKLNGDVSKSASATLGSTVTFANLESSLENYNYTDVLEVSLPKPTHSSGWAPYGSFHIGKMDTDKNSWTHIKVEMAAWNVNSAGGTSSETATSDASPNANGTGFSGSTLYVNYMDTPTPSHANVSGNGQLTWTTTALIGESDGSEINTGLLPTSNDYITDGSITKQIVSAVRVDLRPEINSDTVVVTYSGYESGLSLANIQFREAISSGGTGHYVTKARTDWIAVDDAYNDFAVAGVWSDTSGSATVSHGVKAKIIIRGHQQHGSSEQANENRTVYSATGFLMGVR